MQAGRGGGYPDVVRCYSPLPAGWKFWIPAASINFYAVPLKYQVLYMSACGVLWTAYLSYASNMPQAAPAPVAAEAAPAKSCCSGKKAK